MKKEEEKKTPIAWEVKDPELPAIHSTVPGILLGVLVFEVLKICLQYMRVDPAYTYVAQGVVIVIAVALDLRKYLAKK